MLPSLDDWLRAKKLRNYLILSRDFNDQRILQSDWTRALSGHTHSRVIVSDLTLSFWLSPCKNSKALVDSFQRYWWSKNRAFYLGKRYNKPHRNRNASLRCYLPSMTTSMRKKLCHQMTLSQDIDDQRTLQPAWARGTTDHTQP